MVRRKSASCDGVKLAFGIGRGVMDGVVDGVAGPAGVDEAGCGAAITVGVLSLVGVALTSSGACHVNGSMPPRGVSEDRSAHAMRNAMSTHHSRRRS